MSNLAQRLTDVGLTPEVIERRDGLCIAYLMPNSLPGTQQTVTNWLAKAGLTLRNYGIDGGREYVAFDGDDDELEPRERERLANYEAVIEGGLKEFWNVGMALAAIRSERLYRAKHDTFDAYCLDRWGFSASRARQLILGTSTREYIESVTGVTLSSERETRALRKYDDDLQPIIVETVVNRYGDVTESRIERVGDMYTKLRATGQVDVEGVDTVVDAHLNQADEEASKRAKQYAADNATRDPNTPTYKELLAALECAEYVINRLVSGVPVEIDEGLNTLRQIRSVIGRAGGKLS